VAPDIRISSPVVTVGPRLADEVVAVTHPVQAEPVVWEADDVAAAVEGESVEPAVALTELEPGGPASEPLRLGLAEAGDFLDPRPAEPALSEVADLCTRLARVVERAELASVLEDAAAMLDAVGLIVWFWDARVAALRPSLAHGYSDAMLARMPVVKVNAANAIAAAFRSAAPCVVEASDGGTGAVVVPLMGPGGCVGLLAVELPKGGEHRPWVCPLATILAAQLATLLAATPVAEARSA
jgi:hypothetical protein